MKPVLRRLWDRLSIYLPVALMGVFALATLWLVRSVPGTLAPAPAGPPRHEADYFIRRLALQTFDAQGRLRSEVFSELAHHYPDTDTLEMSQVRMRSRSAEGRLTTGTARHAEASGDGTHVKLSGQVRLQREGRTDAPEPMDYEGEFLEVFTKSDRVRSDRPVVVRRGQDRFTADGLDYDDPTRILVMEGHVQGQLHPRRTR